MENFVRNRTRERALEVQQRAREFGMSAELWGLPPEERASRYRARAEEARLMATAVSDALVQASLQKLAHDWDDLAVHTLTNGRPR